MKPPYISLHAARLTTLLTGVPPANKLEALVFENTNTYVTLAS